MQCIYLFTPQEAEIVGNSRQSSSVVNSLGSFFMAPHKSSSCLWLFPFPLYDKFKKPLLLLQVPQIMTRQQPLSIHLPPGHWLSMKSLPTEAYQCKKGVSQIHPPVSGVNFSNNISIPQPRVNIKKTEHDATFEIS